MTISADRGCFGAGARRSGSIAGLQLGAIGSNLFGQGLLLLPVVGVMAVIRGLFVSIVALLYILFAVGCLLGKSWGWWAGMTTAVVNLLLVFSAVMQRESLIQRLLWSVVPVILIFLSFHIRKNILRLLVLEHLACCWTNVQ